MASTPNYTNDSLSTPAKLVTINTPLRPCSRQKAKELQDDIKAAVDEQSVPLLRVALQRRHACLGDHALHEAVRQAQVQAVRLLLQGRADPNARCLCLERGCELPLQLAVSCTNYLRSIDRYQVVALLLRAGARPDPRRSDAEGNTPLHDAVRRGDLDVVQLLLRYAANPNAINGFGEAPLHLVLRPAGGNFVPPAAALAMAEVLLRAGACPVGPDGCGLPAAAAGADRQVVALLERWAGWWRCRTLAWIRSRGRGHLVCRLLPELLVQVGAFM